MTLSELFNHPVVNLDKQVRYSNLKVMFPENVAEHSSLVINLAMIIATELMNENSKVKIDLKDVAYRGAIHDWGESVTCDITTDVKYSTPGLPEILEKIETNGLRKLKFSEEFIYDINKSREGSIEGDLIMLADRLQSFFKMNKEYMIQRTKYWRSAIIKNSIPCILEIIDYINNKYYSGYSITLNNLCIGVGDIKNLILSKIDFL